MAETSATVSQLDKFRNIVRDFKARFAVLSSNSYGAAIARTGDNALMQEYGDTLRRMTTINNTIDSVMNAYQDVRDYVGLGVVFPLIPLAVIAGVSLTVAAALKTMNTFMLRAGVAQIQQENPSLSYTQAAAQYTSASRGVFGETLDTVQMALLLGAAVLAYLFFVR